MLSLIRPVSSIMDPESVAEQKPHADARPYRSRSLLPTATELTVTTDEEERYPWMVEQPDRLCAKCP